MNFELFGEYGVNRTHELKGSNSYRNGSLSLSTPHRVRRQRSLTSAKRKNERKSTHVYEKVKVHMTSFAYRASGVTKFKIIKIYCEDPRQLFTNICTPENYPLYGSCFQLQHYSRKTYSITWRIVIIMKTAPYSHTDRILSLLPLLALANYDVVLAKRYAILYLFVPNTLLSKRLRGFTPLPTSKISLRVHIN